MRGDGRVFQRGKRWWIAYYAPHQGHIKEMRESAGATEKEAKKRLKARLHEVHNHLQGIRPFQGPGQQRVTVLELLEVLERHYQVNRLASWRRLNSHLDHIRAYFGMDRALAVTPHRLMNYVVLRQEEGAKPATINRELDGLQRAFSLAIDKQMLAYAPKFPNLPEHNAREGFFDRGDFEALLGSLTVRGKVDANLQDFCQWFFWTGMRPGEIKALTWAAFDRETWAIRLPARSAKIREGRMLALEGDLRTIIERRMHARRLDSPLIFHRQGKPVGDFRKVWKRACLKAGVHGMILYDLRRTAVRNMVRAGVDPDVVMKISGHKTRSIFSRYNIISDTDIREAVLKTHDYVATLPKQSKIQSVC